MYEMYSKYYDRLNDDYSLWYNFIDKIIGDNKKGKTIIEFGCGTGNILKKYSNECKITGVDLSPKMLDLAKNKIPQGKFHLQDMTDFISDEKFDLALCLYDTLNHVLDFEKWGIFFNNVSRILEKNGAFLFDINTTERLSELLGLTPIMKEFDEGYFYLNLVRKNETNFLFDVRILKKTQEALFREEKEIVEETTRPGKEVHSLLKKYFRNISVFNEKKIKLTENNFQKNENSRWIFICKN